MTEAVTAHGYSQMQVANFLEPHHSTVSQMLMIPWTLLRGKFTPLNDCWPNNAVVKIC